MKDALDVYHRPYDPKRPQVCLDEASKQLLAHARDPLLLQPGQPERIDSDYIRQGTANLFVLFEPLRGWRHIEVTDQRAPDKASLCQQVLPWETRRNQAEIRVDGRLTTADARIKLRRLYPSILP